MDAPLPLTARPSWTPKLRPWFFRLWRIWRSHTLRRRQRITQIEVRGEGPLRQALDEGAGVLLTPNHAFAYDAYVLSEASYRLGRPFYYLAAAEVFAVAPALQRWILQAQGAFSIDLDRNDLGAFRHAADILQNSPYPLVVFPEGDITYTNDRITPFNKGAAAIALAAAKRAQRKVLCVPCALKCSYVGDPTASLLEQVRYLEERLLLRPRPDLPAPARICRLAEAVLCLKEVAYLGHAQPGPSPPRATRLAEHILAELGQRYGLSAGGKRLEVVGELRRRIKDPARWNQADSDRQRVMDDSKDLSFALGLCNYPVSYVLEYPSPERLADALDMLSAGICGDGSLRVHGERRVVCWFGEPIGVSASPARKEAEARLTATLEQRVQGILDQIAAEEQTHTRDRLRTVRHPV